MKLKSDHAYLVGGHDYTIFNKENVTNYISRGLANDAPVAMLIGLNDELENIKVTQPNGYSWIQPSFATHWVTITEMEIDSIKDKVTLKVSTWGGYSYMDLDKFIDGEWIYECLLYFQ